MKTDSVNIFLNRAIKLLVALSLLALSGCSLLFPSNSLDSANGQAAGKSWLKSGSLVIARGMPQSASVAPTNLLGFMPQTVDTQPQNYSLMLDRRTRTGSIYHGAVKLEEFTLKDIVGLEPGEYRIVHKQRHPVWYAPDNYYTNRGLPIPAADDRSRYLKGALGDFVIYLDEQSPIHNAQVWSDDVGGVRISDNSIAKMYYQLEVGSRVTIQ